MVEAKLIMQRKFLARAVFGFALLSLCFRFLLQVTPSQWLSPPLFQFNFDYSYWGLHLSGLRSLLVDQQVAAIIFEVLLLAVCTLSFTLPLKNVFPIAFFFLFLVYVMCYNSVIVHHAHPLTIMTIASLPFTVRDHKLWQLLWQGFRYYVCFVYSASFVWKIIGGSLWYPLMGEGSVKSNLAAYLYLYPDTLLSGIYSFLISHPFLLHYGTTAVFTLEGLLVVGFFTRRWDRLLFFLPILIHGATYFFADVFFMEMCVGVLPFLTDKQLLRVHSFFNRKTGAPA